MVLGNEVDRNGANIRRERDEALRLGDYDRVGTTGTEVLRELEVHSRSWRRRHDTLANRFCLRRRGGGSPVLDAKPPLAR